jgi:hypothetical protein
MKKVHICWSMLIFSLPVIGLAREPLEFCVLSQAKAPVKDVVTTFVFINAFPHGQDASSTTCPRQRLLVDFSIGRDARAQSFYTAMFRRPAKLSGLREIQATVDYLPGSILVKRIHQYRELTGSEAEPFSPKFSPPEEAVIRKTLDDAARAADSAARR